jgi:hypothetical protein
MNVNTADGRPTSSISSIAAILSFANRGLGGKTGSCDMGMALARQNTKAV